MKIAQLITGIILILGGIGFAIGSLFSTFTFLIYSAILIILGISILFNKNEDKIEERKDLNKILNKK